MSNGELIIICALWFFAGLVWGWAARRDEINKLREQVASDKALRALERALNA